MLRGHRESIAKRLERDLEAMTALPGAPFEACHQAAGQVSSQSLVRYHNNDYSVPVAYGHRQVWVRGYVDRAPDRGAARPTDPSRSYPGIERPELPPQPQPRAKHRALRPDLRVAASRKLRSGYALPSFPADTAPDLIPTPSDHLTPKAAVAVFCSVHWSGFSPPLTNSRPGQGTRVRAAGCANERCRAHDGSLAVFSRLNGSRISRGTDSGIEFVSF